MFRKTDIALIVVMISAAAFTYKTKHDAENNYSEVRRLQAQIQLERNAIDVLHADWSLMTQPSRLQRLAEHFEEELQLTPIESYQFADIADVPLREVEIENQPDRPLENLAQNATPGHGGAVR